MDASHGTLTRGTFLVDNRPMEEEDPMAAIRARYVKHERLPITTLTAVARGTGCDVSPSRMRGVNYEVGYRGMCIGTIGVDDGVPYIEMSKRETPASIMDGIANGVQRARNQQRAQAMGRGLGVG